MSTATKTPDVASTDSTAITTKKTSSKVDKKPSGKKPAPEKCLGFSSKATIQSLATSAKTQYEQVVAYTGRSDVSLDDLYLCAEAHHKSGATAIAVATAGYMWLTEGALLSAMKTKVVVAGNNWQSYYEEKLKVIFGGKSIRSMQVCIKMHTDHQQALKKDAEMVDRAISENSRVNDLAKSLSTIASGGDPWRAPTAAEEATLKAKKVETLRQRPNKLVEELQSLLHQQGYSQELQDQLDDFIKAMQTDKVDPKIVDDTNVVTIPKAPCPEIPEPFTMEGLKRQTPPLTNLVMS